MKIKILLLPSIGGLPTFPTSSGIYPWQKGLRKCRIFFLANVAQEEKLINLTVLRNAYIDNDCL